jgi:hypothetical protein
MRHGYDRNFSVKGIQIAINYWKKNGHEVVCFVPDYVLDYEQVAEKIKMKKLGITNIEVKASHIPDDMSLICKLHTAGFIVSTPSQDYDDSYCIQYAKKTNAFIVTNDKFRDYIDTLFTQADDPQNQPQGKKGKKKQPSPGKSDNPNVDKQLIKKEQTWLRSHSISYTFNKDEFLPNPDSKVWNLKCCVFDDYRNYANDLV